MRTTIVDSQTSIVVVRVNQQMVDSELRTPKSKSYNDGQKFFDNNIVVVVIQDGRWKGNKDGRWKGNKDGRWKGNMETLMLEMTPSPSDTSICDQNIRSIGRWWNEGYTIISRQKA